MVFSRCDVFGFIVDAHVPYTLAFYLFQLLAGTHPPGTPSAAPNDNQQNPSEVAAPPAEEPGGGGGDDDDDSSSSSSSDASSLGRILNATNYSDSTRAYFAPLTPAGPPTPPLVVRIGGNEASVQVDVCALLPVLLIPACLLHLSNTVFSSNYLDPIAVKITLAQWGHKRHPLVFKCTFFH